MIFISMIILYTKGFVLSKFPNEPKPVKIDADRNKSVMNLKWSNGEEVEFSFDLLRNSCPCAACRGGHDNMQSEPDSTMFIIPLMDAKTTQLVNIKAVGSYAIGFEWADGHSAGIFTWHYLYSLYLQQKARNQ